MPLQLLPRHQMIEKLAALFHPVVHDPEGAMFCAPGRCEEPARLIIGHDVDNVDVELELEPGPDTLAFLQDLREAVEDAIVWNDEQICARCGQCLADLGHHCESCIDHLQIAERARRDQEEHDREMAFSARQEHLEDDRRQRQADFAAEASLDRIARPEVQ